jgi:uncharacterized caspase-like protein
MWRLFAIVALACQTSLLTLLLTPQPALADKRVALVIGNSAYQNVNRLPNPANDAAAIAAMLTKIGFDTVLSKEDVGNADMRKMVRDFSSEAADADVALVYYAGHGIELNGSNYLVPVDARLEHDVDVEDEAVSLDRIVRILDPVKKLRLVILDACRDNPFQETMKRSISTRGVTRGLAKVEPDNPNTLIAYAAKAGSTASDGAGDHSPFTTSLLKQLPVPGQDLRKSLGYVRDDVLKQTGHQQEPFVYGSLGGDDVVLVPGATTAAIPAQVAALDPNSQLRQDYELAAQINTKAGWEAFLKTYPNGFYADLARAAENKLGDQAASQAAARNLSAAQPSDHPQPGNAAGLSITDFVGKSFRVNFNEVQAQASPNPGRIGNFGRETAIYIKSVDQITSRYGPTPPVNNIGRYASAPPGGVDQGIQVSYDGTQFLLIFQAPDHRVKVTITPSGNTCAATVAYELMPGKTTYTFQSAATGELVTLSSKTANHIVCWLTSTDEVGAPPVAAAQPTATPDAGTAAQQSADTTNGACATIRAACLNAGFAYGEAQKGFGLIDDCVRPIVNRLSQPPNAKKRLPVVDPKVADACRADRNATTADAPSRGRR